MIHYGFAAYWAFFHIHSFTSLFVVLSILVCLCIFVRLLNLLNILFLGSLGHFSFLNPSIICLFMAHRMKCASLLYLSFLLLIIIVIFWYTLSFNLKTITRSNFTGFKYAIVVRYYAFFDVAFFYEFLDHSFAYRIR